MKKIKIISVLRGRAFLCFFYIYLCFFFFFFVADQRGKFPPSSTRDINPLVLLLVGFSTATLSHLQPLQRFVLMVWVIEVARNNFLWDEFLVSVGTSRSGVIWPMVASPCQFQLLLLNKATSDEDQSNPTVSSFI